MSDKQYALGADLNFSEENIGLESFEQNIVPTCTSCGTVNQKAPHFRPVNIVAEGGQYYVTMFVCKLTNGTALTQSTAIWLQTLKPTDQVNLSVSSLIANLPHALMVDILGAILASPAKIRIYLDQIVIDNLAYFYFAADEILKRYAGDLYVPSYVANRANDASNASRAVHDVFLRLVDYAGERGILTKEEVDKLHSGIHVVIPQDRFPNNV